MSSYTNDTIAGIATPTGGGVGGGIGIVRLSGMDALITGLKAFKFKHNVKKPRNRVLHFGHVMDDGTVIDEALFVYFPAPATYTCEDVVEIHCHGGAQSLRRVFAVLLKNGARPAEPGEFTKRAFLNGRIDLARAEAVMDVISAGSEKALILAGKTLEGRLSTAVEELYNDLTIEAAAIEFYLDNASHPFGEIENEPAASPTYPNLNSIYDRLDNLCNTYNTGRIIKDGIQTAIIGRPNVGKSSILNALAGTERAIVTDIPGTTRDVLNENIILYGESYGNITLNISDTAGIRNDANETVEEIGISRAIKSAETAELILFVYDGAAGFTPEDLDVFNITQNLSAQLICIKNKADLPQIPDTASIDISPISISAKTNSGFDALYTEIGNVFNINSKTVSEESVIITNERHYRLLRNALSNLSAAIHSISSGMTEDLTVMDIQEAAANLGEIIGKNVSEDLIDTIFSKFCVGK